MLVGLKLHQKPPQNNRSFFSKQEELDANPKALHQAEFARQLKKPDDNGNATDTGNNQSTFA